MCPNWLDMVAGYCFVQMTENRRKVSSATELAYWKLIDAYDYTYVTINGAHNLTNESPVIGNG